MELLVPVYRVATDRRLTCTQPTDQQRLSIATRQVDRAVTVSLGPRLDRHQTYLIDNCSHSNRHRLTTGTSYCRSGVYLNERCKTPIAVTACGLPCKTAFIHQDLLTLTYDRLTARSLSLRSWPPAGFFPGLDKLGVWTLKTKVSQQCTRVQGWSPSKL